MGIWGLFAVPFDIDYDGHFGVSDVILLLTLIAGIVGAIKAIYEVVKYVRAKTRERFVHQVKDTLTPALEEIRKQLVPNGGDSLRDDIHAIQDKLETVDERLTNVEDKVSAITEGEHPTGNLG